ncbi:head GIN domain-containing protein [Arenibacterium sp. LLYu02]|uniref:head GIN domain-containing protein n=1 Tax=Arenibacterium sp. LLYu02 TaxID=3404132 RepID=UPI003B2212AF
MSTFKFLPLLGTAAFLSLSTQAAFAEETTYDFAGFTRVTAAEGIEVTVISGATDYRVTAQAGGLTGTSPLKITQKGDRLTIERKQRWSLMMGIFDGQLKVTVELPQLAELSAQAGVRAVLTGQVAPQVALEVSSGSSLSAAGIEAEAIRLEATSGSELSISGQCQRLEVSASSGAEIDAYDLRCAEVRASASSGADVDLTATQMLQAQVSSGGDVSVKGNPSDSDISHSFGGAVRIES